MSHRFHQQADHHPFSASSDIHDVGIPQSIRKPPPPVFEGGQRRGPLASAVAGGRTPTSLSPREILMQYRKPSPATQSSRAFPSSALQSWNRRPENEDDYSSASNYRQQQSRDNQYQQPQKEQNRIHALKSHRQYRSERCLTEGSTMFRGAGGGGGFRAGLVRQSSRLSGLARQASRRSGLVRQSSRGSASTLTSNYASFADDDSFNDFTVASTGAYSSNNGRIPPVASYPNPSGREGIRENYRDMPPRDNMMQRCPSARNLSNSRASDHSYENFARKSEGLPTKAAPMDAKAIEISPGVFAKLRGAHETWDCIQRDFYTPLQCMGCTLNLCCIQDADYVICPLCRVVSPMENGSDYPGRKGGVGLGFTFEELGQWQREFMTRGSK